MFLFREKNPTEQGTWPAGCVEFDRDFPKESFDQNDPDNSPTESVLLYSCGMIHESRRFTFTLAANDVRIDLPIRYEMSMLLEQLDGVLAFLRKQSALAVVDFFEQGYTFQVHFSRHEEWVRVCITGPSETRTVDVDERELRRSISRLLLNFLAAVTDLTPSILKEPAFEKWFSETLLQLSW